MIHSSRLAAAAILLLAGLLSSLPSMAQDLHPSRRPSPMGVARISLGDTYVKVVYSRPYQRGRDNIFGTEESGALVPFGQIWRTGANEATEITLTGDLMVAGERLPAGTYSIFTVPGPDTWLVQFNSALGLTGTGTFEDGQFTPVDLSTTEVLTVEAEARKTEEEVDQFTISLAKTDAGADLVLTWIDTEIRIPIAPAAS